MPRRYSPGVCPRPSVQGNGPFVLLFLMDLLVHPSCPGPPQGVVVVAFIPRIRGLLWHVLLSVLLSLLLLVLVRVQTVRILFELR